MITIERATEKDLQQIHSLIEMCYRGQFSKNGWTSESDFIDGARTTAESLRDLMGVGNFLIHSDEDKNIIGCIYTRAINLEKTLYVGMLSVHPLLQSRGLGTKLMASAEEVAREEGCTKLTIKVITSRTELIGWYERQGYKCSGEFTPFIPVVNGVGEPKVPIEFGIWVKHLE